MHHLETHDQNSTNPFEDQKPVYPFNLNPHQAMLNAQPISRPASAMPQMTPGQVPPHMMMGMFQNVFHPLMNGVQNNRVNSWLDNFGSSSPGVPSVLSQLSLGGSHLSVLSRNTGMSMLKLEQQDEKFQKADLDFVITTLNENADFMDIEINRRVLEIVGNIKNMKRELGSDLTEALWKALGKIDCRQFIGRPAASELLKQFHELVKQFYTLNKKYSEVTTEMDDADKQRLVCSLLILLRYEFDESLLHILHKLVSKSPECQRLFCLRHDPSQPHLDSLLTLRRLCSEFANLNTGVRQRPRPVLACLSLFLNLLTYHQRREELQYRLELCECFMAECFGNLMRTFSESVQVIVNNNRLPIQQRQNHEFFETIVRYISRLVFTLSEVDSLVDRLVDTQLIEQSAKLVPNLTHLSRTGFEARKNFIRVFANLSSCTERLRQRNLAEAVLFTLDCINHIYQYTPQQINTLKIQEPEKVVLLGVGFISNVSLYNPQIQEMFTQHPQQLEFIIKLAGGCAQYLQQNQLEAPRIKIMLSIIENCVDALCHLSESSNPLQHSAIQQLFANPCIMYFTNFALLQADNFKMSMHSVIVILTMWKRGLRNGYYPAPPAQELNQQTDITSGLLGFFTQRILEVGQAGQKEQDTRRLESALALAQEILHHLIENPIYAQLIEQKLCHVNRDLKLFQTLKHLNPTSACLMLKFMASCCKLENLKQIWSSERDYQSNLINQTILRQFCQSNDENIRMLSSLIYQQLFPAEYSLVDVFAGPTY